MTMLTELQKQFLTKLWHIRDQHGYASTNYAEWGVEHGLSRDEAFRMFEGLEVTGLAENRTLGANAVITTKGMLNAEENGLIDSEKVIEHYMFRTAFLLHLAELRDEKGVHADEQWEDVLRQRNLDERLFNANHQLLLDCGLIENQTYSGFKITQEGYEKVWDLRRRISRIDQLNALKQGGNVTPQQRGHELEALVKEAVEDQGWEATLNPRAPGEENDLLLHRDFATFVVSCKWTRTAAGVDVISDLRDRITQRPGSVGLLLSMSGFTETAVSKISGRMESALILPFGPKDIEGVLGQSFNELIKSKRKAAMDHRRFDWS